MSQVLIIEEDPRALSFFVDTLSKEATVYGFLDWSNAIACLLKMRFDLILLSLDLSGFNGVELAKILRSTCPSRVVLISDLNDAEIKERVRSCQADGSMRRILEEEYLRFRVKQFLAADARARGEGRVRTRQTVNLRKRAERPERPEPAETKGSFYTKAHEQDPNATRLRELTERYRGSTEEQFVRDHPHWFLLQMNMLEAVAEKGEFFTQSGPVSNSQIPIDASLTAVFLLKKRDAQSFGHMITVGRAANNDVVLDSTRVSKFHSYLTSRDGRYYIRDSNSTNGTFVRGGQIDSEGFHEIFNEDQIAFSNALKFKFLSAKALFSRLRYCRSIFAF